MIVVDQGPFGMIFYNLEDICPFAKKQKRGTILTNGDAVGSSERNCKWLQFQ
jgi:hypothetical protein